MGKNIAFVFARGGSKGLPGKNIRPLCGKPLLAYSIDTAQKCRDIEQVFVSTDDADIASIAKQYGALVIDRPRELATDTSPEWLSWQHAINWVTQYYGLFDTFVSLPATSPFTLPSDVSRALKKHQKSGTDICLSVTPSNHHPSFNMVSFDEKEQVQLVMPLPNKVTRRQELPNTFNITTCVYVASTCFIRNNRGLFDGSATAIEIPRERAIDIDDLLDFKFADFLINEQKSNEKK